MVDYYKNFINGEWVNSIDNRSFENRNPANWDEIIGIFPNSNEKDVNEAVRGARTVFDSWRLTPAPERGAILKKVGDLLAEHKQEIARLMTREMGKVLAETLGDVQEGIDTAYYAAAEGRRLFGHTVPSELPNKFNMSLRMPIGVAGVITPWNFPMAIPTWKIFPALVCGNTLVFKPASDVPATATKLVELLLEAGIPAKVISLVHGSGKNVGMPLIQHPDINLITFTGSSNVGKIISRESGKDLKRISLELGGKNAQIVMDDANLDLALDGVIWGAFGTTGQRCTATSRLILHENIYDRFMEMMLERTKKLVLGDGLKKNTDVGPLINEAQRDTVHSYVKIGLEEGAKLEAGGEPETEGD